MDTDEEGDLGEWASLRCWLAYVGACSAGCALHTTAASQSGTRAARVRASQRMSPPVLQAPA